MKVRTNIVLHQYGKVEHFKKQEALFDSGASMSAISDRITKVKDSSGFDLDKFDRPKTIKLAVEDKEGEIIGISMLVVEMDGCLFPLPDVFYVIKDLREDVIIGRDLLDKYDIILSKNKPKLKKIPPEMEII